MTPDASGRGTFSTSPNLHFLLVFLGKPVFDELSIGPECVCKALKETFKGWDFECLIEWQRR
jgi:hypothetical protein